MQMSKYVKIAQQPDKTLKVILVKSYETKKPVM